MKVLNIEVTTRGDVFASRYDLFNSLGAGIYHLTAENSQVSYPNFADIKYVSEQSLSAFVEAAKAWNQIHAFDALITTDEASVITAAAITEALGLPGLSIDAAQKSRNKFFMREAHKAGNAPHPRYAMCDTLDEALTAAKDIGYPLIIKPTLGGNAEHVYLIADENALRDRLPATIRANQQNSYSKHDAQCEELGPNSMLLEAYLSGSEHCIEAWILDGVAHIGSISDRLSEQLQVFDNDLYRTPSTLNTQQLAKLQQALQAGVAAQGIQQGVVHAEFRFEQGEPYILEIAARVGGGSLYKMARISYDYCPITAAFNVATQSSMQASTLRPTGKVAVGLTMLCGQGKITKIHVPAIVEEHKNVFNLGILAQEGDTHLRPPEGNDIFGYIGTTGDSQEQAIALASELFSKIQIEIAPEITAVTEANRHA